MQAKPKTRADDQYYMRRALELARRAKGKTYPNPAVGAVIVKAGRIVGEGYHKKAGFAHAEISALKMAGKRAQGASLYVTLEPCSNYGKTPPCVKAIINAGVKKVIIAGADPNPLNRLKGIKKLRQSGLEVRIGILRSDAQKLNADFNKFIKCKMPYVTLKIAQTLDGKMAARNGQSRWITSPVSRRMVHKMRSESAAVLTGIGTVLNDDPALTCRLAAKSGGVNPRRILLDSNLRVSLKAGILRKNCPEVIIFTSQNPNKVKFRLLSGEPHIRIIKLTPRASGLPLRKILRQLAKMNIVSLFVETGPRLASSFIKQHLADRVVFFTAPKLLADNKGLTLSCGVKKRIPRVGIFKNVTYKILGGDVMMEAYV